MTLQRSDRAKSLLFTVQNRTMLEITKLFDGGFATSVDRVTLQSREVMNGSSPIAQALADAVAPHFEQHFAAARRDGYDRLAVPPERNSITPMVDAAFWASLRREEGYVPTISLAYLSPDQAKRAIRFDAPLSLDPGTLTKIAPAVERPGVHLAVWPEKGELCVWGTTRELPSFCFVLEVIAPGLLVVKHSRAGSSGKFVNVAVLEGDRIKVINEGADRLPDCPGVVSSLLGFEGPAQSEYTSILVQIAVSMRDHGRGGLLLVVPRNSDWQESILQPIPYAVAPPFSELAELAANRRDHDQIWRDALGRSVAMVAGLTAVDGATIISKEYELLAFGAKIGRRQHSDRIEQITITEPIIGAKPEVVNVAQLGGTRHIYGAQFVHDQHDSVAMVASQDGRFTIFAWSPCEKMVHAHRVEALLL
jgi:hypothetical protein